MRGADAPVIEAAINSEGKVVIDPAVPEEVRDSVVDICEHAPARKVQDADVLRVDVVIAKQPRLEDMRRMRPAPRHVPLIAEPGEQQLRLVSGEHRSALVV
jgi:hypothetical protein